MDGVLVDARDWHYEALNRALGLFGFQISHEDHLASFDGLPTSTKLDMLTTDRGLPHGLHGFINDLKQQYTVEIIHTKCRPVFAREYALNRLKSSGYKLAVASNSIASTVQLMMNHSGLAPYLDLQVAATDVTAPKPDPEIYAVTAARLGVLTSECLVVEDSQFGIASARAAGAHLLEVTGTDDVTFTAVASRIAEINERSNE
jgi:beta-phosphoglucomutase